MKMCVCDFCYQTENEVEHIVVSGDVCICNECVYICYNVVNQKKPHQRGNADEAGQNRQCLYTEDEPHV